MENTTTIEEKHYLSPFATEITPTTSLPTKMIEENTSIGSSTKLDEKQSQLPSKNLSQYFAEILHQILNSKLSSASTEVNHTTTLKPNSSTEYLSNGSSSKPAEHHQFPRENLGQYFSEILHKILNSELSSPSTEVNHTTSLSTNSSTEYLLNGSSSKPAEQHQLPNNNLGQYFGQILHKVLNFELSLPTNSSRNNSLNKSVSDPAERRQLGGVLNQFQGYDPSQGAGVANPPSNEEIIRLLQEYRGIAKKYPRGQKIQEGYKPGENFMQSGKNLKFDSRQGGADQGSITQPTPNVQYDTEDIPSGPTYVPTTEGDDYDDDQDATGGQKDTTQNEAQGQASRFTTRRSTTTRRRRTTPKRFSFEEDCDYQAYYCLRAYRTGEVCARTIYFVSITFENYCMVDYVNCIERFDIWQIEHMGECFFLPLLSSYNAQLQISFGTDSNSTKTVTREHLSTTSTPKVDTIANYLCDGPPNRRNYEKNTLRPLSDHEIAEILKEYKELIKNGNFSRNRQKSNEENQYGSYPNYAERFSANQGRPIQPPRYRGHGSYNIQVAMRQPNHPGVSSNNVQMYQGSQRGSISQNYNPSGYGSQSNKYMQRGVPNSENQPGVSSNKAQIYRGSQRGSMSQNIPSGYGSQINYNMQRGVPNSQNQPGVSLNNAYMSHDRQSGTVGQYYNPSSFRDQSNYNIQGGSPNAQNQPGFKSNNAQMYHANPKVPMRSHYNPSSNKGGKNYKIPVAREQPEVPNDSAADIKDVPPAEVQIPDQSQEKEELIKQGRRSEIEDNEDENQRERIGSGEVDEILGAIPGYVKVPGVKDPDDRYSIEARNLGLDPEIGDIGEIAGKLLEQSNLPEAKDKMDAAGAQVTQNVAAGAASRFTTRTTTTTRRRRTTPYRAKTFEENCDYSAYYCMRAYNTGKVCGRQLYWKRQTFTNYCMLDYVNCIERYDIWHIAHMGPCYIPKLATNYIHYQYKDDHFMDEYFLIEDMK